MSSAPTSALERIVEKLNDAVNNPYFFKVGDKQCIAMNHYANEAYDRVIAVFLLLANEYVYFQSNTRLIYPKMGVSEHWLSVWSIIQDFDFSDIKIEIK